MSDEGVKKEWSEKERLELAAKLDSELDDFVNGLEKKPYTEGWPEDHWQEEMEKHPFFMKKTPLPGDEVHPMFEGLQKLKYDPKENTSEELALNYKEDGNFYVKHKRFRLAVYSFSEGLKVKCEKPEVQAVLYNNRSAAHFFLKNYRSALIDAQRALEYKSNYTKARWRAAQCAAQLNKFELCTQLCGEILKQDKENEEAGELLRQNETKKREFERDERREKIKDRKKITQFHLLCDTLRKRAIKFDYFQNTNSCSITKELLLPKFLPLEEFPVHFAEDEETLVWPSAFSYPEFLFSDFMQQLNENVIIGDCLEDLFAEPLDCDKTHSYRPGNLSVYYENRKAASVHKIDLRKTIKEILNEKSFYVTGGSLLFYVVPSGSQQEQEFICQQRRPMVYT